MKRIFSIIFLLIITVFFAGCAAKNDKNTGRRVPEVLLARDCGLDKMKCCDEDPPCSYGQECCADPNDSSKNYCSDSCSCGAKEEFCCAGGLCQGDLACLGGLCQSCGREKEFCCPAKREACGLGLICSGERCEKCGLVGNACCPGDNGCWSDKKGRAECSLGKCVACGYGGHPACQSGEKCLAGNLLTNGRCEYCGGFNQPCCQNERCEEKSGLKCELGFCARE